MDDQERYGQSDMTSSSSTFMNEVAKKGQLKLKGDDG